MKYLKSLFVLISITASTFSLACLNGESKILSTGSYIYEDREGNIPHGHTFYTENLDNDLKKIDSLFAIKPDADLLSDKGLILIFAKKISTSDRFVFRSREKISKQIFYCV